MLPAFIFRLMERRGKSTSPEHTKGHNVCRIVLGVKFKEFLSNINAQAGGNSPEGDQVPCAELAIGVGGNREMPADLVDSACVILQIALVLRIDSVQLTIRT